MAYTHRLTIEIIASPENKLVKADCEFNEDGIATFQVIEYGTGGLTMEQARIVDRFVELGKKVLNEFGEFSKIKIDKI